MASISSKTGVQALNDTLLIGSDLRVNFQRTLRIPDDGKRYPLPPGFGSFPIHRIDDYRSAVPDAWKDHGGVFMPLWQREALWLSFAGSRSHTALQVGVGKVCALSGQPWSNELRAPDGPHQTQNYVVAPDQRWLDGINVGNGVIRQFVAMRLGMGLTIEGQITGEERFGGIQLQAFAAKPGRLPQSPAFSTRGGFVGASAVGGLEALGAPASAPASGILRSARRTRSRSAEMGLAAGGRMEQKILPDAYGIDVWDPATRERVFVHIVNSEMYQEITGRPAPASPIDAHTYTKNNMPWFELYEEHAGDIPASSILQGVKSVAQKDAEHGFVGQQDDSTVQIQDGQVITLGKKTTWPKDDHAVSDGNW